ncbi:MAG: helix-turn-helix transcriptional regulator [Deltaproteobacteria bacterium]|nr:helix-turn-helix transcriptional regulator [Deltaproteobacteria bacterium]
MAQEKKPMQQSFGTRLAASRKAAGYTQAALGAELGVSQRMIAYYESPEANPPATMLAAMATVLGVSVDVLVGVVPLPKRTGKPSNSRVQRRLQQLEKLGPQEQRQVWQLVDVLVERERLKRHARA